MRMLMLEYVALGHYHRDKNSTSQTNANGIGHSDAQWTKGFVYPMEPDSCMSLSIRPYLCVLAMYLPSPLLV